MSLVVIPRERWLDFAPRSRTSASHAGKPAVVHWFGPGARELGLEGGIAQCQGFARYHVHTLGWADYAYSWTILADRRADGLATVLEGRGRDVRGAHSGHNTANGYAGVMILAGTETPGPLASQIRSLQELAARERWTRFTGHLEWSSTTCPGPSIWPWVQAHRAPELERVPTYPHGKTLRVVVNGRYWTGDADGWGSALYALRWIAARGLKLEAKAAIAWKGNVWRKAPGEHHGTLTNVSRTLLNRYDGGWLS